MNKKYQLTLQLLQINQKKVISSNKICITQKLVKNRGENTKLRLKQTKPNQSQKLGCNFQVSLPKSKLQKFNITAQRQIKPLQNHLQLNFSTIKSQYLSNTNLMLDKTSPRQGHLGQSQKQNNIPVFILKVPQQTTAHRRIQSNLQREQINRQMEDIYCGNFKLKRIG